MKKIALCFSFLLLAFASNAQVKSDLTPIGDKIESYNKNLSIEKLYLSFDKPYYNAGDTLWFKSFLLNADLSASIRTAKIYVELFNDSAKFVENRVILLNNGLGYGDFALKKDLREGTYTIRAYSNWQQNFGGEYFFQKTFYVGNAEEKSWLLDSYQQLKLEGTKRNLDLKIRITNLKHEVIGLRDLEVYLMNGKKKVMSANLQTKVDGTLITQIPLSDTKLSGDYRFYIIDKLDKNRKSVLPVYLQDVNEVDLQFMPEGGNMINNIYGKVAFKAIGPDGYGKEISGKIVNNKNEVVAELTTIHKGMGSFYLFPQKGESYFAVYNLGEREQKQQLPFAKDEGTSLRIEHLSKADTLMLYIKATESKRINENYQLVAQVNEELQLAIPINLKNGFSTLKLAKKEFPDGVVHFTLFAPDQSPLNQRQALINHRQKINLQVKPNRTVYQSKDSVTLDVTATKEDGSPLAGSFSISVTDDQQVKQETNEEQIASYFLLQSNLKGKIENPTWYFTSSNEASTQLALDQLLLTQGWVAYHWEDLIRLNKLPSFKAEKNSDIEGQVTGFNKTPSPDMKVTLMSLGKTIFATDTTTNAEGKFLFKNLPLLDSATYSIKIKNVKGKISNATITVDEFTHAPDITTIEPLKPWYVNPDSTLLKYYTLKQKQNKIDEGQSNNKVNLLREVEVKGQLKLKNFVEKTAWDSKFFTQISEEDLKKEPRKKLIDLIKAKIPNFRVGYDWTPSCSGRQAHHSFPNYLIGSSLVSHIMIDGTNTHLADSGIDDQYNQSLEGTSNTNSSTTIYTTNQYILSTLDAQDVIDITVFKGCAYYFIDIKTRSGKGPWIVTSPGMYVYRPLPFYTAKDFYSPKYTASSNLSNPDIRSTIFWDANIVTDQNGKAKITFFAADHPKSYTIKLEGTDLQGRFGFYKGKINMETSAKSK